MGKRRAKKTVKAAATSSPMHKENGDDEMRDDFAVELRIGAIRVMRDAEIEQSLAAWRLLRSSFTEEQLQTPVLRFFKENLPNLSIVKNEENGWCEVKRNDRDEYLSMNHDIEKDTNASLLHCFHANCSNIPLFAGTDLPSEVKMSSFGANNLQFRDSLCSTRFSFPSLMKGPLDNHMMHDGLQTPGLTSQRLSVGMTPKTLRVPKPGEMLLSVHGSPLGVYGDIKMEAIHESEGG